MFKNYTMINATQYVVVWHKVVNIMGSARAALSRRTPARRCDEDPPDPQDIKG